MFVVAMGLLLIGISVGWFLSCPGDTGVCQITRSFSIGWGIFGLIGLAMGIFSWVEDRKNAGNSDAPSERPSED